MKKDPQSTVELDTPIKREGGDITSISLRKPVTGELRGLSLVDLIQLDANTLQKLLPRISQPSLTEAEVQKMDIADLTACGMVVSGFLAQKSLKEQYQPQ